MYGFWPADADGDDIVVYATSRERTKRLGSHMLRQQWETRAKRFPLAGRLRRAAANRAARIIWAPSQSRPASAATNWSKDFAAQHDDYHAIMAKALADRLAEAFAEWLHARARDEWGYGASERLSNDELIDEQYRGIRPAPGYPACPDHTRKADAVRLAWTPERRSASVDGVVRDVAGGERERAVLRPPGGAVFRGRSARPRSGRGLRETQGRR